jgi:hypothetical protein
MHEKYGEIVIQVKENSSFDVPFYREMVTGEPFPAVF